MMHVSPWNHNRIEQGHRCNPQPRSMGIAHADRRAAANNIVNIPAPSRVAGDVYRSTKTVVTNPVRQINKPGLNGLSHGSTSGLQTGYFTASAIQPINYAVQEVQGLLDPSNKTLLRGVVPNSFPQQLADDPINTSTLNRFIVMDDVVYSIYGEQLRQYLNHHKVRYTILPLPTQEENKSFELVYQMVDAIEEFKLDRRKDPIIAIGGGVCLDVAGLAANLYRRNTGIIKVPTSLMGVVDAAIGIKTAVNFHDKKNKLGTYCPPLAVFIDTAFLNTLPARHLSNGAAEILKMACIKDRTLFNLLEEHASSLLANNFQGPLATQVTRRSIQGMLEELECNFYEHILERVVDYGHTFSPEIEMAALRCNNMLLHGEAVNIDMALTTEIAYNRGYISLMERHRVFRIMGALKLPLWHQCIDVDLLMKGLEDMTRARDGQQRVPLMAGIGAATFVHDISREEVAAAAYSVQQMSAASQPVASLLGNDDDLEIYVNGSGIIKESLKSLIPHPSVVPV